MADKKKQTIDPASQPLIGCAMEIGLTDTWDRLKQQTPQCQFGELGICCRNCSMGPCRIDPFGEGAQRGVCGATADAIVARNLVRKTCSGMAAHADHGREIVHALRMTGEGSAEGYKIKSPEKLRELAREYGIEEEGKPDGKVAVDVADFLLKEFGRQEGMTANAARAPQQQRGNWDACGATPRGIDREGVTGMHTTHIGVDHDPVNLLMTCARIALADGWGGSMIGTDLSDVLFGSPHPLKSRVNLGVLKEDEVNLVVHGHEPTLSDMIVAASQDPDIIAAAKEKGANGINLAGLCCTATEVLMRHGIPTAGNFLQQELALMTGAVDAMVVDVQCVFPSLAEIQGSFHTQVISTSPKAKFPGATHVEFHEEKAMETAKELIGIAIEAFGNRNKTAVNIPSQQEPLVAGFTTDVIFEFLGGKYRPSFRPLNDGIETGRIRGVAGVVGCNNTRVTHDHGHVEMVKELIKNDVLVVQTGCSAIACGKNGLLVPEAAEKYAGEGLQEICRAVGIPPVLHCGSCVDNSRILTACAEMVKEGGIGDSFDKLPVVGAAPEWMSEKAISIGMYFVASGISVVINKPLPVLGSERVTKLLTEDFEEYFGATWSFEEDPIKGAHLMIDRIDAKRDELSLSKLMYDVPYKPKTAETAAEPVGTAADDNPGTGE